MRTKLALALNYPRSLFRDFIDVDDCRHDRHFQPGDPLCRTCILGSDCRWLMDNEEFAVLEQRSLEELVQAADYALGFVETQASFWAHDDETCSCESCSWLRATRSLVAQAREELSMDSPEGSGRRDRG